MSKRERYKRIRARLSEAQNHRCCYCGVRMTEPGEGPLATTATLEHVRRRADGGTSSQDNLVVACQDCNVHRHASPPARYADRRAKVRADRDAYAEWRANEPPHAMPTLADVFGMAA